MITVHVAPEAPGDGSLPGVAPDRDPRLWEREGGRHLRKSCGADLDGVLRALKRNRSVVRISGLSRDFAPPASPYRDESRWSQIPIALANVFGIVELLGARSFAYATENGGRVIRNVVARADAHDEYSSQGWGLQLAWHMDDAFRPLNDNEAERMPRQGAAPRWLVFGVIHDLPRVPLLVAAIDDVTKRLGARDLEALCRRDFDVRSPASFLEVRMSRRLPIFVSDGTGGWFSRFDQLNCVGRTAAARNALCSLARVLADESVWQTVELGVGDVVVLDNYRSVHARAAYAPRWNGADRWLIRVYAAPPAFRGEPANPDMPHLWS
jgi:hypothetical protein